MSDYILVHHGIKGQKWGVRRYQNPDGTLTSAGIKRYKQDLHKEAAKKAENEYGKAYAFADKNDLDTDDYIFPEDRKRYAKMYKSYGIDDKTAAAVIKYSEMLDLAEAKESEYYAEAEKLVNEAIKARKLPSIKL